ncbi:MAG: tetratricopeptide repeat protein [Gemmatimonadaceae bacterium]|nr:tetratricopeptide repeat protein [Gemmatimonadaceae bacterium]
MTAQSRVDDLKKRYHENPRRFFAPLANEYRKTGFVDRAILLCEKHLGEQPANMNGLVVYGQCLVEVGRHAEAQGPFEAALALDPENLIALRNLGDIARVVGDDEAARGWYLKVLELDRRNDEVLAILDELGGRPEPPSVRSSIAQNLVSVAGSVSLAASDAPVEVPPVEEAPSATPPVHRPPTPPMPNAAVPTPPRHRTPVDPSAKTVEVSAQSAAPKRASIFDVAFDFGEGAGSADSPPAVAPPSPPAAASSPRLTPPVAPRLTPPVPPPAVTPAAGDLDDLLEDLPSSMPLELVKTTPITLPVDRPGRAPSATPPIPLAPLVDGHEESNLGDLEPVEGLFKLPFDAPVAPLADLEPTEFTGTSSATPVSGLETGEFEPPTSAPTTVEGLESDDFTPMEFPDASTARLSSDIEISPDHSFGEIVDEAPATPPVLPPAPPATSALPELPAEPDDFGSVEPLVHTPPERRGSVAGLPLLTPLGSPTPADLPAVEEAPRNRQATPAAFVTETMAQVYVQQGHLDKAKDVYRQLIAQSPEDAGLRARLAALDAPPPAEAAPIAEAVPVAEPPRRPSLGFDGIVEAASDEPAPANAMLNAMSFDGVALATPRGATPATPMPATPTPAAPTPAATAVRGPSAREFFARFAQRSVTPPASTPVFTAAVGEAPAANGRLLSPLDALFGPRVRPEDEAAAHRLASIGATSGPSGGSALDSLFGEGPSAPMPAALPAAATPTGRPSVARASDKLKFDQFFATSVPDAVPAEEPPSASGPSAPADGAGGPEGGDDDDLDQFHGWLKGLTS